MAELDPECIKVGLLDIENCIPRVKALIDKCIEVLGKTQLGKNRLQRSRHAVEVWDVGLRNSAECLNRWRAPFREDNVLGEYQWPALDSK